MTSFDVEGALRMPPIYSLNLTSAQRSTLAWLESNGGVFSPVEADADEIGSACGISVSTVYDALARLTALQLIQRTPWGYRINPRYFFAANPEVRELVAEALAAPEVEPDQRARRPRKVGNIESRRRQIIRSA